MYYMDLVNTDNTKKIYYQKIPYRFGSIKEEGSAPSTRPIQCPICFETMWSDTKKIECNNCNQKMCKKCSKKIHNSCKKKKLVYSCPFCRFVDDEESNIYTVNDIQHEIHIDPIVRVTHRRYCFPKQLTLVLIIIIFIILFFIY